MHKFLRLLALALTMSSLSAAGANIDALMNAHWVQSSSPHFRVVTDQDAATARQLVTDLERMRHFSLRVLGIDTIEGMPPLTIVAIGNSWLFHKLGLPENYAGFFSSTVRGVAALANVHKYIGDGAKITDARTTLLHEYHLFLVHMTQVPAAYPLWCGKGMGDYFSTFRYDDTSVSVGYIDARHNRIQDLFDRNGRIRIDSAELFNTTSLDYTDTTSGGTDALFAFYARASFVVHYFNSSPALRLQLANYLRLYNLGFSQDRAAILAFKRSYAELDKDIAAYLGRGLDARVFKAADGAFKFPPVDIRVEAIDPPRVAAVLASVLPKVGVPSDVGDAVLAKNLELNRDSAQANIASLLYASAPPPTTKARDVFERFPNNAELLTLQGDGLRTHADILRGSGLPGWQELLLQARDKYRNAVKADPAYAAPYLGLGKLYLHLAATEPLSEGIAGFDTASIYQPTPEVFHGLATLALRAGQQVDALDALRHAVAFAPKERYSEDALLLDNLELLNDLRQGAPSATADGLVYRSGTRYVGQLSGLKPHGSGKLTRLNGSYLEGSFADGLPVAGKLVSERGGDYDGEFVAGVAGGQGTLHTPGVSYTGGIEWAKPSGRGAWTGPDGRYEGSFAAGVRHGQGGFTPARAAAPLAGAWVYGSYVWPAVDGTVFVGAIDAAGQPSGPGFCHTGTGASLHACRRGETHSKSTASKE